MKMQRSSKIHYQAPVTFILTLSGLSISHPLRWGSPWVSQLKKKFGWQRQLGVDSLCRRCLPLFSQKMSEVWVVNLCSRLSALHVTEVWRLSIGSEHHFQSKILKVSLPSGQERPNIITPTFINLPMANSWWARITHRWGFLQLPMAGPPHQRQSNSVASSFDAPWSLPRSWNATRCYQYSAQNESHCIDGSW
jgi:hypothetical protein